MMYNTIANGEVDVICAFATDGRIRAYQLKPLQDDRAFFPPYYAAPVARKKCLKKILRLKRHYCPWAAFWMMRPCSV